MLPEKITIATGGTGGHIFPAVAFADAMKKLNPQVLIRFSGGKNSMEAQKIPLAGYPIDTLTIHGIYRTFSLKNVYRNLTFPLVYFISILTAAKGLKKFKPDLVVGFGGYASAPAVRAARLLNIPYALHESNAFPGLVTRTFASGAKLVMIGDEAVKPKINSSKIVFTGNPVRNSVFTSNHSEARKKFNFSESDKVLLILGGSLGSAAINKAVSENIEVFISKDINVLWQCGARYYDQYKHLVEDKAGIRLMPFIQDMADAYATADLVVSRSGSGILAEIKALNMPSILIPSPNVAEDHQTRNAESLSKIGAAILLPEREINQSFERVVIETISDAKKLESLRSTLKSLPHLESDKLIVDQVVKLFNKTSNN